MSKKNKQIITFEAEKYQHHLDHSGLNDAEKDEYIQTMWNLVCEFVKLGFEIETEDKKPENSTLSDKKMISSSDHSLTNILNPNARNK